jgi:hypothetical protein
MQATLDQQTVKNKTVELAFAARTVIQQLATRDRTPEGLRAQELLEDALTRAIPDGRHELEEVHA